MNKTKISDEKFITLILEEGNIEVKIKYPKRSTLISRLKMLGKLKEILRTI